MLGRGAGDCPEAEVVNNITDVNKNANESLMYARGIDMVILPPKAILKMIEVMIVTTRQATEASHDLASYQR
jgi:hypothetical protein